ncbi:MAG: hypothetical protein RJA33_590 [Actinomycetota bacterium]|jgi:hypothetical protein
MRLLWRFAESRVFTRKAPRRYWRVADQTAGALFDTRDLWQTLSTAPHL